MSVVFVCVSRDVDERKDVSRVRAGGRGSVGEREMFLVGDCKVTMSREFASRASQKTCRGSVKCTA